MTSKSSPKEPKALKFSNKKINLLIIRLKDSIHATSQNQQDITKTISVSEILELCKHARKIFLKQSSMVELDLPIRICGDLHGQYSGLFICFVEFLFDIF